MYKIRFIFVSLFRVTIKYVPKASHRVLPRFFVQPIWENMMDLRPFIVYMHTAYSCLEFEKKDSTNSRIQDTTAVFLRQCILSKYSIYNNTQGCIIISVYKTLKIIEKKRLYRYASAICCPPSRLKKKHATVR